MWTALPENETFLRADLSRNTADELAYAEQARGRELLEELGKSHRSEGRPAQEREPLIVEYAALPGVAMAGSAVRSKRRCAALSEEIGLDGRRLLLSGGVEDRVRPQDDQQEEDEGHHDVDLFAGVHPYLYGPESTVRCGSLVLPSVILPVFTETPFASTFVIWNESSDRGAGP